MFYIVMYSLCRCNTLVKLLEGIMNRDCKMNKTLTIRIDAKLFSGIKKFIRASDDPEVSLSNFVRQAIRSHLQRLMEEKG